MLKQNLSVLPMSSTNTVDIEIRQQYRDDFSTITFMTPSKQASWYWSNLNQVLPSATVKRDGRLTPLERNLINPSVVYSTNFNSSRLGMLIEGNNPSVDSMMIIKEGKVIFEHFNMPYNQQHVWMSNAKIITGTLIAMLVVEGKIEIDQPLKTYIPQLNDKDWGDVLIKDALNMQSGIDAQEDDTTRLATDSSITKLFLTETGEESDYLYTLMNIPVKQHSKKIFEYSSANTQILGLLISKIENKTLSEVVEQRIWSNAGMSGDSYFSLTPDGHEVAHGLYTSNTEDMARFAMLYTNSTAHKIIPQSVVQQIQDGVTPDIYKASPASAEFLAMFPDEPLGSSYQFDAIWKDGDMFKGGMQGQGIYISPKKDTVAVWFSNNIQEYNVAGYIRQFIKNINKY